MIKTLISIALLSAATPVLAQPEITGTSVNVVRTSDLNLSHKADIAELDRRINRAVESVCVRTNTQELTQMMVIRACRAAAGRNAAQQRDAVLASVASAPAVQIASAP